MVGSVQRSTELAQACADLTGKQADLRTLRAHYTEADPAVRRLAREVGALERQTIPRSREPSRASCGCASSSSGAVDAGSADLRKIPPLAVEETRLQRDVTLGGAAVVNLQQRYEEARLARSAACPTYACWIAPRLPQTPAGSLGPILVVLAMIGGLGLGAVGAVLLDHTDRHVHHPTTSRSAWTGDPRRGAARGMAQRQREESAGQVIEALRGVRLSVAHRHGGTDGDRTVTSPGRADGKSFVASNLPSRSRDAGSRTLLIDGGRAARSPAPRPQRLRPPDSPTSSRASCRWRQAIQATSSAT